MPLVVPDLASNTSGQNAQEQWFSKLAGKKISDKHDETSFAKQDLPERHRVLEPDSMKTMDYRPDRMNIYVNEQGIVEKVDFS